MLELLLEMESSLGYSASDRLRATLELTSVHEERAQDGPDTGIDQ